MAPKTEPMMALSVMETELIEAENSPYSKALDVPRACEALPKAIPLPSRLRTLNHSRTEGPIIAPENPAIMTNTTVSEGTPPNPVVIWIATGVVIDLGMRDRIKFFGIPRSSAKK